jgi:chloride channel protein, CIC family
MESNEPERRRNNPSPTNRVKSLLRDIQTHELVRWAFYCLAVGIVAGVGALVFTSFLNFTDSYLLGNIAHYEVPRAAGEGATYPANDTVRWWAILLLPALGGLLTGLLVYTVAPEAEGHGTDAAIDAFHNKQGRIRPIVPLVKMIASGLTIGSGGSAGREGPIAQIGAGFGSVLGRALGLPPADVRRLLIIGAGAGIGAVFRAPLGGALFAASVPYRETDYEHTALMPGIIASVTSYAVYSLLAGTGYEPIFRIDQSVAFQIRQLPAFFLVGVAMIPLSMLYIWVFYGLHGMFKRLPLPRHIVPAIGGLAVGALALKYPAVLGVGYGWLQQAMDGHLTVQFMITIAVLKILATSLTIGSGGSGGVFAPSLVIGGLAGGAIGTTLHHMLPLWFPHPAAFVLVGMAAFFSTAAKTPIASLVLISEMSGGYTLLVPAMLAIATAYMFSSVKWSIFHKQVLNRFASPAHRGTYVVDVLEHVAVLEVLKSTKRVATVQPTTTLSDLSSLIARTRQSIFPVVDDTNHYVGAISLDLLSNVSPELITAGLIIAVDLAERGVHVRPKDNLNTALESLQRSSQDEIPVVDEDGCFKGLLSRRDVLSTYYSRLKELQTA